MSKELAARPSTEIATNAPAFLQGQEAVGLEAATREDYLIPRVQIAQALSPELKRSEPQYIAGLSQGDMFNTVTRENYGTSITVIPLQFFKSRIYFRRREAGGGILCISQNGVDGGTLAPRCDACPKSQWGSAEDGEGGIACTNFMNYPALVLQKNRPPDLASVSLKSTGIKAAKRWNSLMRIRQGPGGGAVPVFAGMYTLRTVEEKNAKGTFFNLLIDNAGWVTEAQFGYAKDLYDQLARRGGVRVDMSGLADEEPAAQATEY